MKEDGVSRAIVRAGAAQLAILTWWRWINDKSLLCKDALKILVVGEV